MKKLSLRLCISIAAVVYLLVVLFNTGFIATDEYWDGITRYVPAQKVSLETLIHPDDVKSPLQILPMYSVAQLAYRMGIESPFNQYHFVIIFWGLISFALCLWAAFVLFKGKNETVLKIAILGLAFHFATPGLITRPMFEALAAPWMALAGACAVLYDEKVKWPALIAGVFCASMSFTLRQQTGFCALVFLVLPLLHKKWGHFVLASISGLILFILSGIPDIFLRGQFHQSLRALAEYNFKHGHEYISQPWYFFFPLIIAFTLLPWFIAKYPPGFLQDYLRRYRALFIILALFLLLHSMFANKFERFIVSMIPVLLFMMVPLFTYFVENFSQRKWRVSSMVALNMVLWFPASFLPAQKNITDLARYMDVHPEYKTIINVEVSLEWLPDAFMRQPGYNISFVDNGHFPGLHPTECDFIVIVNDKAKEKYQDILASRYTFLERFDVNIIEAIAYKLNPEHNVRRSPLTAYGCKK